MENRIAGVERRAGKAPARLEIRQIPGFGLTNVPSPPAATDSSSGSTSSYDPVSSGFSDHSNLYASDGTWSPARITAVVVPCVLVIAVAIAFFVLSFRRRKVVMAERRRTDELWTQRGGTDRKAGDRRLSTDSLVAYVEEKPPRPPFMRDSPSGHSFGTRDSVASFASSLESEYDSRYRPASMIRSPSSGTPPAMHNPFEDPGSAHLSARTSMNSLNGQTNRTVSYDEHSSGGSPASPTHLTSEDTISEEQGLFTAARNGH